VYWINKRTKPEDFVIMMGDFNALPDNETVKWILSEGGFLSSLREYLGEEPDRTFNTGLVSPYIDTDPPCTVDYIFYRPGHQNHASSSATSAGLQVPRIRLTMANVMGHSHDPKDSTLYGSDHFPLVAEFEISPL
jgi:hypothetical protein